MSDASATALQQPIERNTTMTDITTSGIALLDGRWFHTTRTCECPCTARIADYQGQIIGTPAPGVLLVQLYEWLMGEPSTQELWPLERFMADTPALYDSDEDMHYNLRHGQMRHTFKCPGPNEGIR